MVNSGMLDGLTVDEAKKKIIDWLTSEGKGHSKVTTNSVTGYSPVSVIGASLFRWYIVRSAGPYI